MSTNFKNFHEFKMEKNVFMDMWNKVLLCFIGLVIVLLLIGTFSVTVIEANQVQQEAEKELAPDETWAQKGVEFSNKKEYLAAIECFQKAIKLNPGKVLWILNLSVLYYTIEKFPEALGILENALINFTDEESRKQIYLILADVHFVWGRYLSQKSEYINAIKHYEAAYDIDKNLRPKFSGIDLHDIGLAYSAIRDKEKALYYYERALSIFITQSDKENDATTLNNIGKIYSDFYENEKALNCYDRALLLQRAVNDRDGEAKTLNNMGAIYIFIGEKEKAIDSYEKALAIFVDMSSQSGEALTLNNIGDFYETYDEEKKALGFYEKALNIFINIGSKPGIATVMNNMGRNYAALGEKEKALDYYKKALAIFVAEGDQLNEANTLNNFGAIYSSLGMNENALNYYEKSLNLRRANNDSIGEAITLNNMGFIYETLDEQKALDFYKQALSIFKAKNSQTGEATTWNNMGLVYNATGEEKKALDCFEKALFIFVTLRDRSREATALNNIGIINEVLNEKEKAINYYKKALGLYCILDDYEGEGMIFNNLMNFEASLNNTQMAIFFGKQAVNAYQNLRANISKLDRMLKKSYFETEKDTYRILAALLIDEERIPEAQHVLDMLKEKEYFEFTGKNQSTIPTYSQIDFSEFEKQWIDKYKKVTKDYSTSDYYLLNQEKIKNDAEKKQSKERETLLEQYKKDFDKYLRELNEAFAQYNKSIEKGTITTPNSQELLRKRQAVLRQLDEEEGGKNVFLHFLVQDERIAVIFTTPDSQFVRFCNFSKKQLNRLMVDYHQPIKQEEVNIAIYGKFYDSIFKPVDIELKKYGATNLMVYLDGLLRYIALPVLWDGESHLVQRYRIALFTSASFARIQREPGEINKILGLGTSRGGAGLDYVKEEIKNIVNDKDKDFNGLIPGKAFLDDDFTKETFVNQLKTAAFPLVHISSHFVFNNGDDKGEDSGDETKSYLLMGDRSLMNLKEIREKGNLFDRVELLMLSACETGQGDADGREIDGFGELAQQSGAQCVVASLWEVPAESTKDLMVNFYRILKEGKVTSKIEALRQAQLQLAGLEDLLNKNSHASQTGSENKKYPNPYCWGPFIMMGNWR